MAGVLLLHESQFASARTQESCSLLHRVEAKPAVMPFSFDRQSCLSRFYLFFLVVFPPPILSQTRSAHQKKQRDLSSPPATSSFPVLFQTCSSSRPLIIHLGGVIFQYDAGKVGLLACLDVQHCCYGCCYKNVILSLLSCKCKNVGKGHRGQLHTGGNWP